MTVTRVTIDPHIIFARDVGRAFARGISGRINGNLIVPRALFDGIEGEVYTQRSASGVTTYSKLLKVQGQPTGSVFVWTFDPPALELEDAA